MKYLVTVLSLLVATASVVGGQRAANSKVAEFALQDQFGNLVDISLYKGSIVVIIASDKEGIDQNENWEKAILQKNGDDIILLRVADVRGVPSDLRKYVRKKFQEIKLSILLDWDGTIFRQYGLMKNVSNLILIDRKGYIRYMSSGPAETPAVDRLFNEIDVLERSR
ncbi:MAG TPA: hypothetical protein VL197_15275 [Nitrospirota bacterium]|nr:hypothetical protein [Nitrospirota bacterium]